MPLPSLSGYARADVCVIGLGGSGLACIAELLSLGARVVGIDAVAVAGGASGRNGGFLRAGVSLFHHEAVARLGRDRAARLYRLTVAERERMLVETPRAVRRSGYLRLAHDTDEARDCRAHLAALQADDIAAEWYDGPEGQGVLVREDAVCNPLARCRQVAHRVLSSGARLFERTRAVAVRGDRVETEDGAVRCRAVVAAVDGGLQSLLPEVAHRVHTARLQMLATEPLEERVFPFAVGTRWGWDYWQQDVSGAIALGGGRDIGGAAEWTSDATPSAPVQEALTRCLVDGLGITATITHRWAATVGYTDDALPLFAEARPRVWTVGAYSGTGNLVGAVAGRAAAHAAFGSRRQSPFD
jgi:glycine/D-amino acid oxidase-like deaminating enzyme